MYFYAWTDINYLRNLSRNYVFVLFLWPILLPFLQISKITINPFFIEHNIPYSKSHKIYSEYEKKINKSLYIYSDNYKPVLDIIHIMNWSFFIYAIGGRKEILLQYSGYVQYINVANLSRPIIFLIIGFFLYPIYGLKGIALASLTTTILNQIYMYICIKYLLKFKPYGLF